jgi:hypothetical protein
MQKYWYILWSFGMISVVLICGTKKNRGSNPVVMKQKNDTMSRKLHIAEMYLHTYLYVPSIIFPFQ